MKKLLFIIITGITLCTAVQGKEQAIDLCGKTKPCIKDFKIEKMGVGDSLLDFFTKKEIKKAKASLRKYKNNKYTMLIVDGFEEFDEVWISYRTKDKKNYEITYIKGVKIIGDKNQCRSAREKMKSSLISSWNMTFMKSSSDPETYLFGAPALGRNWFWGKFGCTNDGMSGRSGFDLIIAPQTETWSKWYMKAYIPGKS